MSARMAHVTEVKRYGKAVLLRLMLPDAPRVMPGQFAHLLCDHGNERVLRRPYSVFDQQGDIISIFARVTGAGSAWLAARLPGDTVDVMVPLGNGWERPDAGSLLVAGGSGIAPLHYLARWAQECELIWGLDCEDDYGELPRELARGTFLSLATCDGSAGFHGTALDLVRERLRQKASRGLYACGPEAMLRPLAALAREAGVACQVSLEERMACGIGACLGCATPAAASGGKKYLRVCADGPVFDAARVGWEVE